MNIRMALVLIGFTCGCGAAPSPSTSGGSSAGSTDSSNSPSAPNTPTPTPTPAPPPAAAASIAASPPPPAAPTSCPKRSGTFQYQAAYLSGTCGTAPITGTFDPSTCNQIFCTPYMDAFDKVGGSVSPPTDACTGQIKLSSDDCSVEYTLNCPSNDGYGDSFQKVGKVTWTKDGKSASGSESLTGFSPDGSAICSGQYQVSITSL